MDERKRIWACFSAFVEGSLITHDIERVLTLFCDDVMGIGMGAQGIVRCKDDLRPILLNTRNDVDDSQTTIQYSNMQIRYYGDNYANISATLTITTTNQGERRSSHIGQCASMRRIDGEWKINMVQATPLSIDIQEIDAYPLSFAEDEIENYRKQEQFSTMMQRSIIATYKIDFDAGVFEDYISHGGSSEPVRKGDPYESKLFESAMVLVDDETRVKFLETFSIDHLRKFYQNGETDLSLDYESPQPGGGVVWLRNHMRLFTDMKGHLKGYLYLFDIDGPRRRSIHLTEQVELDLATGIYNKDTTRKKIETAVGLHITPMTCAFFMIDLDNFKQINDTYGHAMGDEILRKTAEILKHLFRKEDIVGRLGGDEFCVFYLGDNDEEILAKKASQICEEIRQIRPAKDGMPGTSASIGIAARQYSDEVFDVLYEKADIALYVQKLKEGRDGFTIYNETFE